MIIPYIPDYNVAQSYIDEGGIAHYMGEETKVAGAHNYLAFSDLDDYEQYDVVTINGEKYIAILSLVLNKELFLDLLVYMGDTRDMWIFHTCIDGNDEDYLFVFLFPYDK